MKTTTQALFLAFCCFVAIAAVFYLRTGAGSGQGTGAAALQHGTLTEHPDGRDRDSAGFYEDAEDVFNEFRDWLATDGDIERGAELAQARSVIMRDMIRRDPAKALEEAVGFGDYERLPDAVKMYVEEPFSIMASVSVFPVCHGEEATTASDSQVIEISDGSKKETLSGYVYGKKQGLLSRERVPVQGIRLGGIAALREGVFQQVLSEDADAVARQYPPGQSDLSRSVVTGSPVGERAVMAVSGGLRFIFADVAEMEELDAKLAALDSMPGPNAGSGLFHLMLLAGNSGGGSTELRQVFAEASEQASAWTESPKNVFIIRVDFSDHTNGAFPLPSAAAIEQVFDVAVSDQIQAMSYQKTSIQATVSASVTRMPSPTTAYTPSINGNSNNSLLHNDAKAAYLAANAGWSESDYDIIGVYFDGIGMLNGGINYSGLASVGGTRLWLQGSYSTNIVTHELGHNYGLGHSSFWSRPVASSNPVDPAGSNDEYGDLFDIMGSGEVPHGHFNLQGKALLNWIPASDWSDATAAGGGVFRVRRIDDPLASGLRGVRVMKGADEFYWIGHRRAYMNENLEYGAYVQWERPGYNRAWFLDMTPGSQSGSTDRNDGGLPLGMTYSDAAAGIHVTPVARGGTDPDEWVDVRVNVGAFAGNHAPTAVLSVPGSVSARTTVMLAVNASDADGDSLAYSWSIDGTRVADNNPTLAYSWTVGGSSTVTVDVSDMKGGVATVSQQIAISDSLETWATRATGRVVDWQAVAHNGTRVVVVGEHAQGSPYNGAWGWSSDGLIWTHGAFGSNEHLYALCHSDGRFIGAGMKYDYAAPAGWRGFINTSTDGAAWTQRYFSGYALGTLAAGNGVVLAGGNDGFLLRSTDGGLSWTLVSPSPVPPGKKIAGLAFGDGSFVLTAHHYNESDGYNGGHLVLTSTDGLTWVDRTAGTSLDSWKDLRKVAYLNGSFYASGWYSKLMRSSDGGVSFSAVTTESFELPALAYGGGVLLGGGKNLAVGTPSAIISSNGIAWSPLVVGADSGVNAAVYYQDSFILVGDADFIRQSGAVGNAASGYVGWRAVHFPDRGQDSQPNGDSDGDSLRTLVEYGVGTSPLSALGADGTSALPKSSVTEVEPLLAGRLALVFSLPDPAPGDIEYTIEISEDDFVSWTPLARKTGAGAWQWLAGGTPRIVSTTSAGIQSVKVGDTELLGDIQRRFLRLRVEIATTPAP